MVLVDMKVRAKRDNAYLIKTGQINFSMKMGEGFGPLSFITKLKDGIRYYNIKYWLAIRKLCKCI